ncbi:MULTISPECIES: hypothetical protein [Pseudomonas syringae group]|uniref:hypothetical protein n=1 Tax=Pseudomonas syringae group TaxID=136849 RepID=UPI0007606B0C|nr:MULTISPECIES: hypothetical protein [Pseudomonas syringae group]AVB12241.1 hypothetical protein BKM19_000170 [Pseudomonas amygdali pv. morsprunorum]AVB12421.1 hypothetical protein BKM19_001290 [Pseudomonas amygdali pv. morsprunorum]KWS51874.1 hypothetical protein AL056_11365 [Pseudomonas amygdali pv. morsprunorum]KWS63840.1 hypothetical protein AL054_02250 [Pseudomonas amygdali pv. morsprunorum]MBI6727622.1 hypothetical protein [Pseudomonas amygdali]
MNNENDSLHDALREASPDQLQALAELATWMAKHHRLLVVGREHGIRIGATDKVIQFMREHLAPELAGKVSENLVRVAN